MSTHDTARGVARACGIALMLAVQIAGALAYSTEPATPPQGNAQPAPLSPFGQQLLLPGQPNAQQPNPADGLPLNGFPGGTEITIPGIGAVGKLPKLDFGLELLYGPKNPPDTIPLDQQRPEGDVQIKGTLSHKF
jgi:hypothetical protein